nr:N-acetylmuramoyl-L-alanine amidase [uncultured Acetatifactor sp.]
MKLVENILTRNPCYTAGRKITVKGLMLHSVGCPQPKASVFINSWNSLSHASSCVHGFIDGNDGTVYQTLPWNHRGWHCGSGNKGSGNNTHIGVEMCEPACIKYTAGSNFTCSNLAEAKAVAKRTYEAAVELFAMLCRKYSLNPLVDGVIISHREGHSRGIASNHGDPEHLWTQLGLGYTMDGFRKAVKVAMSGASSGTDGYTKIMGNAVATAEQMREYLKKKNPDVVQSVLGMIPLYLSEGRAEGVRGDIAFAQSCLETGNFTFSGSAVTLSQNNFCGMGVTSNGMKGNSFDTPQLGIQMQVQHLKAYASKDALANDCIDPRFKYVTRGCAEYVEWLGQKENPAGKGWAAGAGYGEKILAILKAVMDEGKVQFMESLTISAPYMVRVNIPDLNIRRGPGTGYAKTGRYTGIGSFTIVEEADGEGASKWGLLKSCQDKRDGWISLDHTTRV